jgi:hypothetical protein
VSAESDHSGGLDIEHDLVVIPGIIERRDIDLSPPVGEWPLFCAHRTAGVSGSLPFAITAKRHLAIFPYRIAA